ncbi:MAG: cytochrome c [Chloroflexi bacterium]|nr:MAG: cytochrome c [Chloroflexota bacterium]
MKRTWIVVIGALALAAIISACGQDELAGDLTPIPTLRPGEEPALNEALVADTEGDTTPEPSGDNGEASGGADLVAVGEALFADECAGCHGEADGAGPAFTGMAERAATRVEGMSAEDYLHESIVDPSAHVVEGFADIMPKDYDDQFDDEQINGLVAYIMAESGGGEAETEATEETPEATEEGEVTEEPEATEEAEAGSAEEESPQATEDVAASFDGDAAAGEALFAVSCAGCHGEDDGAGPALTGMGERAEAQVEGMTAVEYIHESIVDPSAHVVEGFADIMPKNYEEQLSDEEINNVIAFILTQ